MYDLLIYLFLAFLSISVIIAIVFIAVALPFWRKMQKEHNEMAERIKKQRGLNGRITNHRIKLD